MLKDNIQKKTLSTDESQFTDTISFCKEYNSKNFIIQHTIIHYIYIEIYYNDKCKDYNHKELSQKLG